MTGLEATILALITLAGGYITGRLHGKAKHHDWVAKGFYIMRDRTDARGLGDRPVWEVTCSALDVSAAFGDIRRKADRRG